MPSDTSLIDQADDEILDEDSCHAETNRETPSPSFETELDARVSKSTKEPLKIKPSRQKKNTNLLKVWLSPLQKGKARNQKTTLK